MDEQQMQEQIVQLVLAAMSGDQQANQQILQIMQAAQQGDLQAAQIAQMIQQIAQQMQLQQALVARMGAKLNYIKYLRGKCPEGYQMYYFLKGGAFCNKCVPKNKKGGEAPSGNAVEQFRKIRELKCGGKAKKKYRK